jgi:hypothetical protein
MGGHSRQKSASTEAMPRCLEGDRFPRTLANQLLGSLFDPFQINMSESFRDKGGHRVGTVLVPDVEDNSSLPLQEPPFSLYYVIRPVRPGGRYGHRLSERLFGCVLR